VNIGYARVSTLDQNLDLQVQALRKAGCKRIFREKVSDASDLIRERTSVGRGAAHPAGYSYHGPALCNREQAGHRGGL
jgi:Resolvase, N terminal domain